MPPTRRTAAATTTATSTSNPIRSSTRRFRAASLSLTASSLSPTPRQAESSSSTTNSLSPIKVVNGDGGRDDGGTDESPLTASPSETLLPDPESMAVPPQQPGNSSSKTKLYYACYNCRRAYSGRDLLTTHQAGCSGGGTAAAESTMGTPPPPIIIGLKDPCLSLTTLTGERHLSVLKSRIHGRGLFTGNFIPKGELIIEYTGEAMSRVAALRRQHFYDTHHMDNYIMRIGKTMIDATTTGNCSRYINNSCDPNCDTEHMTLAGRARVLIYSNRNITAGSELTYDYNFQSDELVPCNCGSRNCRKFLNSNIKVLKISEEDLEVLAKMV